MTQSLAEASGLVRVSVVAGERRADLVVPGSVPVAELLPELVRAVGVLDPQTVYGGYTLITEDGRTLAGEVGLTYQGVEDGGVLTVAAGVDEQPTPVYDDVVEAMADAVERDARPWGHAASRRTGLAAAALLFALGAFALGLQGASLATAAAADVVAVLLLAGATVLSRVQREAEAAVTLAWVAVVYAVVAGLAAVDGPLLGAPMVVAGGAAFTAGIVCVLALREGRALLVPAVVAGALFGVCGAVQMVSTFDAPRVFGVAVTIVVIAGSALPWFALAGTGTKVQQAHSHAELTSEPSPIDAHRVRADAAQGHEVLLGITCSVGLVLVLAAPLLVSLGIAGTLLAVVCCLVALLRTRQYRTSSEVLAGMLAGVLGLASVVVSTVVLQPEWRSVVAVTLAVAAAVLLTLTLVTNTPSVRRGRIGDMAESVGLVALLPLLVVAIGLLDAVRG
jgi:type VII secretion integral membrane protein EccD